MRKLLIAAPILIAFAAAAWAAGAEYRAAYNVSAAADAPSQDSLLKCREFSGSNDNLAACTSWCDEWKGAHAQARCSCAPGKCEP